VGTGAFLGGKYAVEKVIAYGGISEANGPGLRSSERIRAQPNADMPQMERAKQQVAAHDPSFYSGTKDLSKFTIASFSDDMIISRAAKLGVSLGNSSNHINESISYLKETNLARTLIVLKRKEDETKYSIEDQGSFLLQEASKLREDLFNESVQNSEEHKAPLV
jgi:hypothetical protein